MNKQEAIKQSIDLVNESEIIMVGSVNEENVPNIKAMMKMEHEGLRTFYFSTNTSSKRVAQFEKNPKACIYFVSFDKWAGLMLVGEMEVLYDRESREKLWNDRSIRYYPKGIDDPDYCVLRFKSSKANYYRALSNVDFKIEEVSL